MKKMVYEKPLMLVEGFVPTQSVANGCGNNLVIEPVEMPLYNEDGSYVTNKAYCNCGNNGHNFDPRKVEEFDDDENGVVVLFASSNNCELKYDLLSSNNKKGNEDFIELGKLLTANGNNSWSGDNGHRLVVEGTRIPS